MDSANMTLMSGCCLGVDVIDISQTAAQNSRISGSRILRRSARSTSSYNASNVQEASDTNLPKRRQHKRRVIAHRPEKACLPLSTDPIQSAKRQPRHRSGPTGAAAAQNMVTQIIIMPPVTGGAASQVGQGTWPRGASPHTTVSDFTDGVPAGVLLALARRSVEMQTDPQGRRPCVMDVILDLRDFAREASSCPMDDDFNVDLANGGAAQSSLQDLHLQHAVPPAVRRYAFHDQTASGPATTICGQDQRLWPWLAAGGGLGGGRAGFPVSGERSTARWADTVVVEFGI